MATILSAVRRVKGHVRQHLDESLILRLCDEVGHRWRNRTLGPVVTLWLFVEQILAGNVACTALRHLCEVDFTAAAYCQARARLPLELFKRLMRSVTESWREETSTLGLWRGHRTFLLDGSNFSMRDTPKLRHHFGQPGNQKVGCGFPVAHLLALFDAATGLMVDVIASPMRTHDMVHASKMLRHLGPGDILIADRGFCSYAYVALVSRDQLHAVFRVHQRHIVDFTPHRPHRASVDKKHRKGRPTSRWLRSLGIKDQLVEWVKPLLPPNWMSREEFDALPATMMVRELRYQVARPGFRTRSVTLVTTLLDPDAYPAAELAELYARRWTVEVNLRHLKTTMGMEELKCESVDGVMKELYVFSLAYNLVRRVMLQAAEQQGVEPDRISFVDALRWLRQASPGDELPPLIIHPLRPHRFEARVRKRRPKPYPLLKQPRPELRKALLDQYIAP